MYFIDYQETFAPVTKINTISRQLFAFGNYYPFLSFIFLVVYN